MILDLRAFAVEAFMAGDALMGYTCRVARGARYTRAELEETSCLDRREITEILSLSREEALEIVREAAVDAAEWAEVREAAVDAAS